MNRRRDRYDGRREPSPMVMMLLFQLWEQFQRLEHKPPVTIGLLACNILPFIMDMNIFGYDLSDVSGNCLNPYKVVSALTIDKTFSWNRIILPAFMHADDCHLYYNMLSLSWKGIHLEQELGSGDFLQLVIFSLITSHLLVVVIAYVLFEILGYSSSMTGYNTCAIGFSAVLFSLKFVWNNLSPETTNVMGISVPSRYAAWVELVIISLITPNVSFLGHLCGILAGMLYLHVFRKLVLYFRRRQDQNDFYYDQYTRNNNRNQSDSWFNSQTRYTYARGTTGTTSSSSNQSQGNGYDQRHQTPPSAEELRQRRRENFSMPLR